MNHVIIVAGGKGLRMGGDIPKQFVPIAGEPILMRTIRQFHHASIGHIVLVLPAFQQAYWRSLCEEYHFGIPVDIATGGETRFHSVSHGLSLISDSDDALVGVHDGVRPFASLATIGRCYACAAESGCAVPVTAVVETLRHLDTDGSHTVSRDHYRLVQTPQVFRLDILRAAYTQHYRSEFTDDASVVESLGRSITLVEGNRENIKITTPFDLRLAEQLIREDLS